MDEEDEVDTEIRRQEELAESIRKMKILNEQEDAERREKEKHARLQKEREEQQQ